MKYELDLTFAASERVRSLKRSDGNRLVGFMEQLAESPFLKGELTVSDATGREIQVVRVERFLIYFWTEHLAKKVHVTRIETIH